MSNGKVNLEFIKAKETYADYLKGSTKDGKIDANEKEAIELFQSEVVKAYSNKEINDETFNQAMGLYKTNPIATTEAKPVGNTDTTQTNPTPISDYKLFTTSIKKLAKTEILLDNVMVKLKDEYDEEVFKDILDNVNELVTILQTKKLSSKEQIEEYRHYINNNKNKKVPAELKNLTDFEKTVLKELLDIVEKEQIEKESNELIEIYNKIKADPNNAKNYTNYINLVKATMSDLGIENTSYYSKEAFKKLEDFVEKDVANWAIDEFLKLDSSKVNYTKKKEVIDSVATQITSGDKFATRVINYNSSVDDMAGVESRRINRERRYEELRAVTREEIEEGLGQKTFDILRKKYLYTKYNEETKTYDLTELSAVINAATGSDEWVNTYEDYKKSEIQEAVNNLKIAIKNGEITEKQLKDIMKFCEIKTAPKDRNVGRAFLEDWKDPVAEGAIVGTALGFINIEQITDYTGTFADVYVEQVVKIPMAASIPAAIGIDFLLNGLTNIIFGMENGERTCFDYEKAEGKTFEKYAEYVKQTESDETKAKAIIAFAKLYVDKYGEDKWNENFLADMKKVAGNEVLNCLEFFKGKLEITKNLSADNASYTKKDYAGEDAKYEDVPVKDMSKYTWDGIVAQYDCLDDILTTVDTPEQYPLCQKKSGNALAVRILKVAQAINDGDYSKERLLQLAELSFEADRNYSNLKNFPGIDHAKLVSTMRAEVIGEVKLPNQLAGCAINPELLKEEEVTNKGGKKTSEGPAQDRIQTSAGSAARYTAQCYVNGILAKEIDTTDMQERDQLIQDFQKQYPNATFRKDTK